MIISKTIEIDAATLEPTVSRPHTVDNTVLAKDLKGVKIHQVFLGTCTNGRIEDFRAAAKMLRGKDVAPHVRLIVIPATQEIFLQMIKEGILQVFIESGGTVSPPTCGPCIGGHMGILAENEVGLYTTNRNFKGRNGHHTSRVYLSSPLVAAASAITGVITDPRSIN